MELSAVCVVRIERKENGTDNGHCVVLGLPHFYHHVIHAASSVNSVMLSQL